MKLKLLASTVYMEVKEINDFFSQSDGITLSERLDGFCGNSQQIYFRDESLTEIRVGAD